MNRDSARLAPLDWLRGLVMLLMTVDHASEVVNKGRLFSDAVWFYKPGTWLDPAQFFTRWITHLCAPTFVFLAGASLALSVSRRVARGESAGGIDRFLITRGLVILLADPLWMSPVFLGPGRVLFQVLYAIGGSMLCMALLRRLPRAWLLGGSLAFIVGGEALIGAGLHLAHGQPTVPLALLLSGGQFDHFIVAYPLLPWLAILVLGWSAGSYLLVTSPERAARSFAVAGAGSLLVFGLVRGQNGYGNLLLYRDDGSLVQWLHVSKYPPSLSFTTLELGISWLLLAAAFAGARAGARLTPLLVLGQTALFYYLLHVHLLELGARATGYAHQAGIAGAFVAAGLAALVLFPACVAYRRYKAAHPDGLARYV